MFESDLALKMRISPLLFALLLLTGSNCIFAENTTAGIKLMAKHKTEHNFVDILPQTFKWYEATEKRLLVKGRPLSTGETDKAIALGVLHPERVRVVVLHHFPMPSNSTLRAAAKKFGFGSDLEIGRTMGYAILVKPQGISDPTVVAHELVHVTQQDRLGREQFVRQILTELATVGYEKSPLEIEAYAKQGGKAVAPKSN